MVVPAALFCLLLLLHAVPLLAAADGPWVTADDPIGSRTIRVTSLGSGSPDVRRHQVRVNQVPADLCVSYEPLQASHATTCTPT